MDEAVVVLRSYNPDQDQGFIYSYWRNQAYYSAEKLPDKPSKVFFSMQTAKIKEILKDAEVRIACLEDSPLTIIGFSVIKKDHLEFIYVKDSYRLKRIGTLLTPKHLNTVSKEMTKVGRIIVNKKNLKEN